LGEAEIQLDLAARDTNFAHLGEAAHAVLSHARLVGCSSLAAAASKLEHAARGNDGEAFDDLLRHTRDEIRSLMATVRRHPGAERPA
jgi:HPt (histidine-containing phosphotransfer) domain-containing protein